MHKFRKETPLQAYQNTQLKQGWEFSMDIDYSTPDFPHNYTDDINLELDKVKEKLYKFDKTENVEINKIKEKIKSSKDDHEIKALCKLIIDLDPTSFSTYFVLFQTLVRLDQFDILEKDSKKALATHNSENIGKELDAYKNTHSILCWIVGFSLLKNKKYTESLEYLEKSLEIDEKNKLALYWKSASLFETKKNQEALQCCNRALEIDDNYLMVWKLKSDILESIEEYQNALYCMDKAISLNENDSDSWRSKGIIYQHMNNHSDALQCFEKALTIDKDNVMIMNYKGVELGELKRWDEAEKCFMHLISIDKFNENAWANLTTTQFSKDFTNYTKILEYASIGLIIEPDNPICLTAKSFALFNLKKYEDALECVEQVFRTEKNVQLYLLKAEILKKLNFKSKSLEYLNEVLSLENLKEDEAVRVLLKKCDLLSESENYEKILNVSSEILAIDKNNLDALNFKIDALYILKEYQKCLEYCNQILDKDENNFEGNFYSSIALFDLKEYSRAEKYCKKVLTIDENNPHVLYNLSFALTEQKKYPEALEFINKFIEMNIPESPIKQAKELHDKLIKKMQEQSI